MIDSDDDASLSDPLMAKGPLPKSVKDEIDTAHARFKTEMAAIAQRARHEVKSCYNYLNADTQIPRAVSYFNIFQIWYGVHGKQSWIGSMSVCWLTCENVDLFSISETFGMDKGGNPRVLCVPTLKTF